MAAAPGLQWGRAFGSAETDTYHAQIDACEKRFNGAALSEARKRMVEHSLKEATRSFNGAALSEARKLWRADLDAIKAGGCFNGAALSEARKRSRSSTSSAAAARSFNGAALSEARKRICYAKLQAS